MRLHRGSTRRALRGLACFPALLVAVPSPGAGSTEVESGNESEWSELDPFVVTGTRTLHRLSEAPIRTELVTPRQLDLAGACNLADSVELLPGVRVENNCQNCGTSDLLLLGLENKYTAILFDGLPLYSGVAAVYGLDQVPSLFTRRIEVVKGGGSAVYGSGAVGGVVNLIGRDPRKSGVTADFRFDSVYGQPRRQASLLLDHANRDTTRRISIYGQVLRADPVDLNHDGLSDLTKREMTVAGGRILQEWDAGILRVDYSLVDEYRRGGNKFDMPDYLADISERIKTVRHAASVAWSGSASPDTDYAVSTGFAYIDRETFYGGLFGMEPSELLTPESGPGAGDNDQVYIDRGYSTHGQVARDQFGFTKDWVFNAEVQVNHRWSRHIGSAGLQYYREKIEDIVPVSDFVTDYPVEAMMESGHNIGAYVQDEWALSDDLSLVYGFRADLNSELDHLIVSPRVNIRWRASEEWSFRATAATGFRAPQFFDEDLHIELIAGDRTRTVQSQVLREERSFSTLLSSEWNPEFAERRMTLETNLFYTGLDGTFTNSETRLDPSSDEVFRERFNGPDARVAGVEFNLGSLPLPNLRVDLGYVWQVAEYDEPVVIYDDGEGAVIREKDFLETPRHYAVLQATWAHDALTESAFTAVYTGSMKVLNERLGWLNERTDAFLVLNASIVRTFELDGLPTLTLTAGIKNIFDQRQKDLESGVDRDPYYFYGPRTPRTVYVGLRVFF